MKDNYDEAFADNEITKEAPTAKWRTVTKKILKIFVIVLVSVVWICIIGVIILRSDDDLVETPILSEKGRDVYLTDRNNFEFYTVHTADFMNDDGSVQLKNNVYAADAHELEVGVRVAWTQLRFCKECNRIYTQMQLIKQDDDDKENDTLLSCNNLHHTIVRASETDRQLAYELTDTDGKAYECTSFVNSYKGINLGFFAIKYEFVRITFGDVYLKTEDNIINIDPLEEKDKALSQAKGENEEDESRNSGTRFFLKLYDKQTGDLLFSSCIYDNNTFIQQKEYEFPDGYVG